MDQEAMFASGSPFRSLLPTPHVSLEQDEPWHSSTVLIHGCLVGVATMSILGPPLASMIYLCQSSGLGSGRAGLGTGRRGGYLGEATVDCILSPSLLVLTRVPVYTVTFALCPP